MSFNTLKYYAQLFIEGIFNSYAQIYFSKNKWLAFALMLVAWMHPLAGFASLIMVVIGQLTALFFHYSHQEIRNGSYTYNSALTGMAIGAYYQFTGAFIVWLVVAAILTFFISVWFMHQLAIKNLPFLSIPFLAVVWLIMMGEKNFAAIEPHDSSAYLVVNHFPLLFSAVTEWIMQWTIADIMLLYFRSMGAILFQYNDLAGILVSIGILIHSRISFILSIYGFLLGFFFYQLMEADFSHLIYSYIGFNFILTSIALGGFFVVASRRSFLLLLPVIPMTAFVISGLHGILFTFGLPLYSLPFNLIVLLILYFLNNRLHATGLFKVPFQHYSPELNHYKHFLNSQRFKSQTYFHISLPFIGEWRVSQGHNGAITHKDDYRYALDFDVVNEDYKTYHQDGDKCSDYYCFNLPVQSPASGWVSSVQDGIDDNEIGQVNLSQNWGNTVVIRHGDYLYSKLSHLKKDSIIVKPGDYLQKGQLIGYCGNSGRSPEPHLHFQLQTYPYIGSKTIFHPIDYYLLRKNNKLQLRSFDLPLEGELVSPIVTTPLLYDAFNFLPGRVLEWKIKKGENFFSNKWEVFTDSSNKTYIYCHQTGAIAYFVNQGTIFYFVDYYGSKKSLLHHFYKGAHRVILGYYEDLQIDDRILNTDLFPSVLNFIHDFTAPFFHYLLSYYTLSFHSQNAIHNPTQLSFVSNLYGKFIHKTIINKQYNFHLSRQCLLSFTYYENNQACEASLSH
ncbi:MAG: urea transporter [Candidatus Competibacteraceae bacterium]|nr:urea transporter [Candidatus Competibacteraceae bacterium]